MIKYEKSVEFTGDLDAAMKLAQNIFTSNGFKMDRIGETELSVTGPGMTSTKQNPIRGLSRGQLKISGATLAFTGELGGVGFMKKFLYLFPPALAIGMTFFFAIKMDLTKQNIMPVLRPVFLAVAPWIVISPLMSKYIQKKTEDAVSTAVENISRAKEFC